MQKVALVVSESKTVTITAVNADSVPSSELAWHEQLRRPKNGAPASRRRPARRQTEPPESLSQQQSPPHEAGAVRSSERESAVAARGAGPLQPGRGRAGSADARVSVRRGGLLDAASSDRDGSLDLSCRLAALEAKVAGWGALPQVTPPEFACACGLGVPAWGASGHKAWTFFAVSLPCKAALSGHGAIANCATLAAAGSGDCIVSHSNSTRQC